MVFQRCREAGVHVWYSSDGNILPIVDDLIECGVSIHDPQRGRYGGQLGGPVFADVMKFALPRLGIPPSGTSAPEIEIFAAGSGGATN